AAGSDAAGSDAAGSDAAGSDPQQRRPAETGFPGADPKEARFDGADLKGARFDRADLSGAEFRGADLSGARFHGADLTGAVMRGVELVDVDINGEVSNLVINGVDVAPLILAELDRRDPDRVLMRPDDAAGFRRAWDLIGERWRGTVERAARLPEELLHESVDGEWSFVETLRHLVFATDSWIGRVVLGDPAPWHPLALPFDEMADVPGVPRDRAARPALGTVLELRRDRMAMMRRVLDGLTDEALAGHTEPVEAPGWPGPRSYAVRDCLSIILNEEYEHRLYAERDLAVLEARTA
ncbi:pentapeptide repeat-containing protein, partial [Spirilliplanes yamanashiensis]